MTSKVPVVLLIGLWIIGSGTCTHLLMTSCSVNDRRGSTTVTCYFSEDITQSELVSGINVQRYDINGSDGRAAPVLDCFWFDRGKGLTCANGSDVSWHSDVTDQLTVSLTTPKEGKYLCHVTAQNIIVDPNFCSLELKEKNAGDHPDKSDKSQLEDGKNLCDDGHGTVGWVFVVLFITLTIAVVLACVSIFRIPQIRVCMLKMLRQPDDKKTADKQDCVTPLTI